jgi:hypothetical protein
MATTNDITGARIVSRPATNSFRANWDAAFGPKPTNEVYIEKVDGFFNIIVDHQNNQNCVLRMNKEQFEELKRQIKTWDSTDFVSMP